MGAKRKSCTPTYRQEAARLAIDTGRTIAQVATVHRRRSPGRWGVGSRSTRMDDPPEKRRPSSRRRARTRAGVRSDRPQKATHDVSRMAWLLGDSRSGYYAWAARRASGQPGPRASRRADLVVKFKVAYDASEGEAFGFQCRSHTGCSPGVRAA